MPADDDALLAALMGKAGGTLVDQVDAALDRAWVLSSGMDLTLPQTGSTPGPYRAGGSTWDLAVDQATARWGTAPKARTLAERVVLLEALVRGIDARRKAGAGGEAAPSAPPTPLPTPATSWPPPGAAWSASWDGSDPRDGGKFDDAPWNWQSTTPVVRSGRLRVEFLPNGAQAPAKGAEKGSGSRRCEMQPTLPAAVRPQVGRTVWHHWDLNLVSFPVQTTEWTVLTQWKQDGTGSPPLALAVRGGRWVLEVHDLGGKQIATHDAGKAEQGRATTLVIGVTYGTSASTGHVVAYQDGAKTLDVGTPTMHPGKSSYLKSPGLYCSSALSGPLCLEVDRMAVGLSRESVTG